jgi:hypothetical protein
MKKLPLLFVSLLLFSIFGCGGGGGAVQVPPNVTISLSPPSATLAIGANQVFTPNLQNASNLAVTFSIQEGAAGGTITPAGVYTAPSMAGTYHVVVTSQADPTKTFTATVIVYPTVEITPLAPSITLRQTQNFTATVRGVTNTAVTWTVQEGAAGGTITPAGLYTAPNTPGTYTIRATSQADPGRFATTTVTVQAGSASVTIQ